MSAHVHRFNGTLIRYKGRCSCGAWASYHRATNTYSPCGAITAKGLETRLRNLRDPDHDPGYDYSREEHKAPEPETTPDVVQVLAGQRRAR